MDPSVCQLNARIVARKTVIGTWWNIKINSLSLRCHFGIKLGVLQKKSCAAQWHPCHHSLTPSKNSQTRESGLISPMLAVLSFTSMLWLTKTPIIFRVSRSPNSANRKEKPSVFCFELGNYVLHTFASLHNWVFMELLFTTAPERKLSPKPFLGMLKEVIRINWNTA